MKYNPEYTCLLSGRQTVSDDQGLRQSIGGNGKPVDPGRRAAARRRPLPRTRTTCRSSAAKGGPGGKPGCGSLPDVSKNWPVRSTGHQHRLGHRSWTCGPTPASASRGYADYFPVTRGVPEPPSIRYPGGPAPGPIPYPGAPPYGAPQYAPDGTPLYPGLPPPRRRGSRANPARPRAEPFVAAGAGDAAADPQHRRCHRRRRLRHDRRPSEPPHRRPCREKSGRRPVAARHLPGGVPARNRSR